MHIAKQRFLIPGLVTIALGLLSWTSPGLAVASGQKGAQAKKQPLSPSVRQLMTYVINLRNAQKKPKWGDHRWNRDFKFNLTKAEQYVAMIRKNENYPEIDKAAALVAKLRAFYDSKGGTGIDAGELAKMKEDYKRMYYLVRNWPAQVHSKSFASDADCTTNSYYEDYEQANWPEFKKRLEADQKKICATVCAHRRQR